MFGPLVFGPLLLAVCIYAWLKGSGDERIVAATCLGGTLATMLVISPLSHRYSGVEEGLMHLPRSAPLVGGFTLALMTFPVIVIAGRNAIKSVPPSIRDAALGVGASKMQVVFHHVLPLAFPGIMTGSIIGMARALGETAPLLMIGMRAFIATPPSGITEPATVLPMQIFLWSDEVDRGFVEKTSAAIIVLLVFMLLMNGLAIYLRNKFERRW